MNMTNVNMTNGIEMSHPTKVFELFGGPLDGQMATHESGKLDDGATVCFFSIIEIDQQGHKNIRGTTDQHFCKRKYRYKLDGGRFVFDRRVG